MERNAAWAKQVVRGLEKTIVNFPIDADVRIAGLFTARETATGALSVATQTLQGLKVSIGSIADVGQFIVKYSLGGLLDVKSARFEATLMAATSKWQVSSAMASASSTERARRIFSRRGWRAARPVPCAPRRLRGSGPGRGSVRSRPG